MAVFKDAEHLYRVMGEFMRKSRERDDLGPGIRNSGLIINFKYTNPEAEITINAANPSEGKYFDVIFGPSDLQPDVAMSMEGDIAHKFWLGNLNLAAALTRRQMVAKGPIQKIMKLLPVIKPAYAIYKEHLKEIGEEELINAG